MIEPTATRVRKVREANGMEAAVAAVDLRKHFRRRQVGKNPLARWLWRRGSRKAEAAAENHGTGGEAREDLIVAVDGVSFEVKPGEIFGLLGPNGAGKTTTIRMLATLLEPSAGHAYICGYDV